MDKQLNDICFRETRIMKKFLWLIFFITIIGCRSIYVPLTQPDQRIQLGEFSFFPPLGENWEMTTYTRMKLDKTSLYTPIGLNWEAFENRNEANFSWKTWGRSTMKFKSFKKSIVGPNQKPYEAEIFKTSIAQYEFKIMRFDHDDDLMEMAKLQLKTADQLGQKVLESNFSIVRFSGMKCVKSSLKKEGGRKLTRSEVIPVIQYFQGYNCVHPRRSNLLIELVTIQAVLKGQTPTDNQNEIDRFINSLQVL